MTDDRRLLPGMARLFQAHPWHAIPTWAEPGRLLNAFIELVPTDAVKYELDPASGQLCVDRPLRFSSVCPTLYGFIPQTLAGPAVGALAAGRTGRAGLEGDGDALDVCVLTERTIRRGGFLTHARPIGGLRTIDGARADDKLIAVLDGNSVYDEVGDVHELPAGVAERLRHYFLTYKEPPGGGALPQVTVIETFDRAEALEVLRRGVADYRAAYGERGGGTT